jgi:hypothetical protein
MRPPLCAATRFWLGVALPTLVLSFVILFLVFVTGQGKGAAPAGVLVLSLFILPATMLVNCWVMFVKWQDRGLLLAAGLEVPLCVGFALAILIHAS